MSTLVTSGIPTENRCSLLTLMGTCGSTDQSLTQNFNTSSEVCFLSRWKGVWFQKVRGHDGGAKDWREKHLGVHILLCKQEVEKVHCGWQGLLKP